MTPLRYWITFLMLAVGSLNVIFGNTASAFLGGICFGMLLIWIAIEIDVLVKAKRAKAVV